MADIIMSDTLYIAQTHRQHRLSAAQGLDLRLFIDGEHNGVIWRVEVQSHDVAYFLDKKRIVGKLECLAAMRLQSKSLKHPVDGGFRQAVGFRRLPNAPVCRARRFGFDGPPQQSGHLLVADGARTARPEFIVEPLNAMFDKSLPPFTHRRFRPIQALGDLRIGNPITRPQHQFGSRDQRMRKAARSRKSAQFLALFHTQFQSRFGTPQQHIQEYVEHKPIASYLWDTTLEGLSLPLARRLSIGPTLLATGERSQMAE